MAEREREREREREMCVHLRCTAQQVLRALLLPLLHARFLPRTRAVYLKIICIPAYPGCQMPIAVTKVLYYTFVLILLSGRKVRANLFNSRHGKREKERERRKREKEREREAAFVYRT